MRASERLQNNEWFQRCFYRNTQYELKVVKPLIYRLIAYTCIRYTVIIAFKLDYRP